MANITSITNYNKEVITKKETKAINCNRINQHDCPLSNQCQITK